MGWSSKWSVTYPTILQWAFRKISHCFSSRVRSAYLQDGIIPGLGGSVVFITMAKFDFVPKTLGELGPLPNGLPVYGLYIGGGPNYSLTVGWSSKKTRLYKAPGMASSFSPLVPRPLAPPARWVLPDKRAGSIPNPPVTCPSQKQGFN